MIAATALASIGPDMDNPRSLAGKIVYPVARWLNKKTGHRTLTHSLVFIAALAVLGSMIEKTFFGQVQFTVVITIAWFVHVLLDTFTLQGVQLMFPFSFEPYWMFEKQEARIRNGDFRAEGTFFIAFIVLTFAQGNLWQNGFWTSYNNQFGTIENLESEMRRSSDALDVVATCKFGTETIERKGLLVELKSSGMVLLSEEGFVQVGDDEVFQHARFQHTGQQLKVESLNLIAISADSLNAILHGKHIKSLEIAANQPFQITEPNGFRKEASSFREGYLSQPPIFSETPFTPSLDTFIADRTFQAEIDLIEAEIQRIQRSDAQAESVQRKHEALISSLRSQYAASSDISERQRIHGQIKELEAKKFPGNDGEKIEALRDRIAKIRKENRLKAEAQRQGIELKNQQELAKLQETFFTGVLSWIVIDQN